MQKRDSSMETKLNEGEGFRFDDGPPVNNEHTLTE